MNRKPLILVLIIVIAIIAGAFFYSPKTLMNLMNKLTSGVKIEKISGGILGVNKNPEIGNFLTDVNGKTLYMFANDTSMASNCDEECAITWPPFLAVDQADGLKDLAKDDISSRLGTIVRKDGSRQITFGPKPLYYYFGDKKSGDVLGLEVNQSWQLVTP